MDIAGYSIEDQVVSEIGRFAILWNEFEKKHRDYGRGKRFRERNYRETAQEENLKLADSLSFDRSSYKFIRNYLLSQMRLHRYDESETKHFVESYLFTDNARINDNSKTNRIEIICCFIEEKGSITEQKCGCIYTIQRYRNNLMHGIKSLDGLNNQIDIFRAINTLLESFDS